MLVGVRVLVISDMNSDEAESWAGAGGGPGARQHMAPVLLRGTTASSILSHSACISRGNGIKCKHICHCNV